MATYKVLQDIEAEDKLLGPLTLRQFIYAIVCVVCLYFTFLVLTKGAAYLSIMFLPPGLLAGFFAFPWGRDQPTELWALAKIRFFIKPRRRIWDQSGIKELVTITAPKKIEKNYTNGLTQIEVKSRLRALADTIDSRGWAIKNVNLNLYSQSAGLLTSQDSDRLIDPGSIPQQVPSYDVLASDDMLDEQNNPVAQQFDQMITASTQEHRRKIIEEMNQERATEAQKKAPADYWFLNQPSAPQAAKKTDAVFAKPQVVIPSSDDPTSPMHTKVSAEEKVLAEKLKKQSGTQQISYAHMRNIKPLAQQQDDAATTKTDDQTTASTPVTPPTDPAILNLANNNDLNVATIARQANKTSNDDGSENEVVISLH